MPGRRPKFLALMDAGTDTGNVNVVDAVRDTLL
jgi:hypothetical protein